MDFERIHARVGGIPFISEKNARYLYNLIIKEGRRNILELGIGHGASTCYIAAALDELQAGKVTAVDLQEPDEELKHPWAEDLVKSCGLEQYVEIVRMKTGYNWFLHDKIVEQTAENRCEPCYDFCIIDGPKNWTIDGAAFFLVDKLLVEGGKIIFDDYKWTYAEADSRREATDGIAHRSLSKAERETPHVKEIVDLLVMQHPDYSKITVLDDGEWIVVKKRAGADRKVVKYGRTITLEEVLARMVMLLRHGGHIAPH